MWFCTIFVTSFILIFPSVLLALAMPLGIWIFSGFDSNALEIDSCLDRGGAWDETAENCMGLS